MATSEPLGTDTSIKLALQEGLRAACSCIDLSNTKCKQEHWLMGINVFNRAEGTQGSLPSSDPGWKKAQKTSHPLALPLGQHWLLLAYMYHKTKATSI